MHSRPLQHLILSCVSLSISGESNKKLAELLQISVCNGFARATHKELYAAIKTFFKIYKTADRLGVSGTSFYRNFGDVMNIDYINNEYLESLEPIFDDETSKTMIDILNKFIDNFKIPKILQHNSNIELKNRTLELDFMLIYDKLMDISDGLRPLYEDNHCEFLSLSSVGPAFFALVSNDKQKEYCLNIMKKLDLDVIDSSICNTKYEVVDSKDSECYWTNENTNLEFQNRPVSKYITDQIDQFNIFIKKCIDIGCGGGRYSKYLDSKNSKVLAIDKYYQMFDHTSGINFINCSMDNIPVVNSSYFLALSIGVMHNATTISEYEDSFKEIYRILEFGGTAIISVFTDDVITSDLSKTGKNTYNIKNRPPMVLYSKQQVLDLVKKIGFKDVMIVDEHVTDVGGGCRNVFTITVKK